MKTFVVTLATLSVLAGTALAAPRATRATTVTPAPAPNPHPWCGSDYHGPFGCGDQQ